MKFGEYAKPLSASPNPEQSPNFVALAQMAHNAGAFIIGGSTPECNDKSSKIYNTCAVHSLQGQLLAAHCKMHLFDVDVPGEMAFHESDTPSAGNKITIVDLDGYGRIGIGICYDMRFAEPSTIAAQQGAFALLYPSAFNTTTGPLHWELLGRVRAIANQIFTSLLAVEGYSLLIPSLGI